MNAKRKAGYFKFREPKNEEIEDEDCFVDDGDFDDRFDPLEATIKEEECEVESDDRTKNK